MFKKNAILIVLLLLLTALMVACASTAQEAEEAVEAVQEEAAEVVEEVEAEVAEAEEAVEEAVEEAEAEVEEVVEEVMGEEVVIQHAQGETAVPLNPQTVVVMDYSILDTLDSIGAPVSGVLQGSLMPAHLEKYNGEAYTNAGSLFEPDFEAINALEPDLIIVALRSATSYEPLSEIAPTIDLTVDDANFLESMAQHAASLGTIFGKEAEVAEQLAAIDEQVTAVSEKAAASEGNALIIMTSGGEVSAFGPGSRFGMIHDLLGVTPVVEDVEAATHGDAISYEFILEQNPDLLYVFDRDAAIGAEGEAATQMLDNELIHATDAWENDNIVYLDTALWYLANSGLTTFPTMLGEVDASLDGAAESAAMAEEMPAEVTIQHAQGETVVPTNPQTVVVMDYSVLDTMDAIGAPVAAVQQGPLVPAHLQQYNGEEYVNAGSLFEPDFEAINALEPDLIIVALRSATSYEPLSEIAPTIDLTVDAADQMASFAQHATSLGTIFGKDVEVAEQLTAINEQITAVSKKAANSGQNALIIMTSGGEVSAFGPGSRFGMIHDILGVTPVVEDIEAATHGDAISYEFILEQNPDILYVFDRDAAIGAEGEAAAEMLDNELIHATAAWENDNIVYLDTALWYLASTGLSTLPTMVDEVDASLSE